MRRRVDSRKKPRRWRQRFSGYPAAAAAAAAAVAVAVARCFPCLPPPRTYISLEAAAAAEAEITGGWAIDSRFARSGRKGAARKMTKEEEEEIEERERKEGKIPPSLDPPPLALPKKCW